MPPVADPEFGSEPEVVAVGPPPVAVIAGKRSVGDELLQLIQNVATPTTK